MLLGASCLTLYEFTIDAVLKIWSFVNGKKQETNYLITNPVLQVQICTSLDNVLIVIHK